MEQVPPCSILYQRPVSPGFKHTFRLRQVFARSTYSQSAVQVFLSWRGTLPAMAYYPDLPLHKSHCCDTRTTEPCQGSRAGGFHLSSNRLMFSMPAQVRSFIYGIIPSTPAACCCSRLSGGRDSKAPSLPLSSLITAGLLLLWSNTCVTPPRAPLGCLVLP